MTHRERIACHNRSGYFVALAILVTSNSAAGQQITTVAGGGYDTSNGIAATQALVGASQGIAIDPAGNIYYWDGSSIVVRKVDTNGIIKTVAGNGTLALAIVGSIGDGGPATSAGFGTPGVFAGVAVDAAGNLYVSDPGNKRVRKVDTSGIITTFAGTGNVIFSQPSGLALDSAGNLYVADATLGRVYKVTPSGAGSVVAGGGTGDDGVAATSAYLLAPYGIAFDRQDNLYIAEDRGRVRKVDSSGVIHTVAGSGSIGYSGDGGAATGALLFGVEGLAIDKSGNLYVADNANNRVRKVDTSGIITTVVGTGVAGNSGDNGLAINARITPGGLALDASGNLYITGGTIRKVSFGSAPPGLYSSAPSLYFEGTVSHPGVPSQVEIVGTLGAPISFNVTASTQSGGSGWLISSTPTGATPQVFSVSIGNGPTTAGTYKGTITLTPTTSGYSPITIQVTYVINAAPPATPVITDVENGASFQSGYLANSIWTIKGTNLASVTDNWNNSVVGGELPTSLDGVTVTFGGYPAYISYISPTQINLLTPDSGLGAPTATVSNNGATSTAFPIPGQSPPFSPAFFLWPNNQAVATRQDYTYAVKPGTFPSVNTIAAKPGDVITLWGTGFGPITPAIQDGAVVPSDKLYSTSTPPTVTVGGVPATVYGAALAAGYAGLYQIAIQVPASLGAGDWPIIATMGGVNPVSSPSNVVLSVAP